MTKTKQNESQRSRISTQAIQLFRQLDQVQDLRPYRSPVFSALKAQTPDLILGKVSKSENEEVEWNSIQDTLIQALQYPHRRRFKGPEPWPWLQDSRSILILGLLGVLASGFLALLLSLLFRS